MAKTRKRKPIRNRINMVIDPEKMTTITEALDTLDNELAFAKPLTKKEREELLKLGDGSITFVNKATELVLLNSDFMPKKFNVEEQTNDTTLFNQLTAISLRLDQLKLKISDTRRLAGSEAYAGALTIYDQAQKADVDDALEPYVDELARRFARKSSSAAVAEEEGSGEPGA
jgi:hypothetical protein